MALLNTKLKAATVVELIVAMVITMICFGIGLMILMNVITSDKASHKLNATLTIDRIAAETKKTAHYYDEVMDEDPLTIHKKIKGYETDPALKILEIKAFDNNGNLLGERKELIFITGNETL